jgi:hypothetical protein
MPRLMPGAFFLGVREADLSDSRLYRNPVSARAITSRWISLVPS